MSRRGVRIVGPIGLRRGSPSGAGTSAPKVARLGTTRLCGLNALQDVGGLRTDVLELLERFCTGERCRHHPLQAGAQLAKEIGFVGSRLLGSVPHEVQEFSEERVVIVPIPSDQIAVFILGNLQLVRIHVEYSTDVRRFPLQARLSTDRNRLSI